MGEEQFEQVNSFKYLYMGRVGNTDSSIEEEIEERIAAEIGHSMFTKNYLHQS
jgi:alpha-D-ribose 1-methylphosphonate 5-triphosphate diphosphatase PhnM